MTRVTLINPPQFTRYPQPPLGLASIAAVLEREGHTVSLLDANALNLSPRDCVVRLPESDVVGITAMTPTINHAMGIAYNIRLARPGLPVILGGAHATLLPQETLGRIVSTPARDNGVDITALPFPAYHLLADYRYRPHPPHGLARPFMAAVTSRGCPYRCAYCSKPVFGSRFRGQAPERVVDEIAYLQERFGVREIAFYDDVFTLDKKRAHAIAAGIMERGLKVRWTCESRVNLVDGELLRHMKRAGCYAVAYGIESASPEILEILHKDITLEQVEAAVRVTREAGMQTVGYLMIGSPGETPDTIAATLDLARRLRLDFAQFSLTTPFPGTELYQLYRQEAPADVPWESFVYSGTGGDAAPLFASRHLSRADLRRWEKRTYRSFYLRPAYLWQRLTGINSLADLKMNIKGLTMLLRSLFASRRGGK
jgi:anaerobic magnesium-protoporphyrin IX monomethyl ester cyclase